MRHLNNVFLGSKRRIRAAEMERRRSDQFKRKLAYLKTMAESITSIYHLDAILCTNVPNVEERAEIRKLLLQFMTPESKVRA